MLHVTNGDAALAVLRESGVPGDFLAWRDALHEGPVPALAPPALRETRARFVAEAGWEPYEPALASFEARDARLEAAVQTGEEIVLWFEHDLYDQLQLIDVLARVGDEAPAALVQTDDYLGRMLPADLAARFAERTPLAPAARALGRAAWAAFTAADPAALEALAAPPADPFAPAPLPYLSTALDRHLQEFPSAEDGLSRTEHQALRALADGPLALADLFVAAHVAAEPAIFMGDTVFFWAVGRLALGEAPLACIGGDPPGATLTEAGRAVLAGEANAATLRGLDVWRGGVHLTAQVPGFRWSRRDGRLVTFPTPTP